MKHQQQSEITKEDLR